MCEIYQNGAHSVSIAVKKEKCEKKQTSEFIPLKGQLISKVFLASSISSKKGTKTSRPEVP